MAFKKNNPKRNSENKIDKKVFSRHWFQYWWVRTITVLASVVLFWTVYVLILPATAVDKDEATEEKGYYIEARPDEETVLAGAELDEHSPEDPQEDEFFASDFSTESETFSFEVDSLPRCVGTLL